MCAVCLLWTFGCGAGSDETDSGAVAIDGGAGDAGKRDAGRDPDASTAIDAGSADAGHALDAGSSDAGRTDAGAFDAGSSPCAFASTLDHSCATDADCDVAIHQTDCCGNTYAIGINDAERARFDALEPACQASYPLCGCPAGPTRTDSGESSFDGTFQVGCITSGPSRTCMTYVTARPPDTP